MRPTAVVLALVVAGACLSARADAPVVAQDASGVAAPSEPAFEAEAVLPGVVDAVEIDGLWRTKPFVVIRELPWKAGQSVTLEQWNLGIERLWSLPIFSRVSGEFVRRDGKLVALLKIEERWTINLILRFGVGGGSFWWALGVSEINFAGRLIETAGYFQRFGDLNGGEAWVRDPRFLNRRDELSFTASQLGRPRPEFVVQRASGRLEYTHQIDDEHMIGGRLEVMHDRLRALTKDDETGPWRSRRARFEGAGASPESTTGGVGGLVRLGRIKTTRLTFEGWQLELRPALYMTDDADHFGFGQVQVQLLYFNRLRPTTNLGVRLLAGATTPAPSQQLFYVGGLDLVRGLPDNALTASAFALANVELRQIFFDSTWFAVMGVAFVDGVVAREARGTNAAIIAPGVGLRLMVPRLVQSGLRIDYAVPMPWADFDPRMPSIGVWQFF